MLRSSEIKRRAGIKRQRRFKKPVSISYPQIKVLKLPRFRMPRFSPLPNILRTRRRKEYFFRACVIAVILLIFAMVFGLLRPGVRVRVDSETVAAFRVPHRAIGLLRVYAAQNGISFPELFAVFNAENNFFPEKHSYYDFDKLENFYVSDFNQLLRRYNPRSLAPYVSMFENLFGEIETFPISKDDDILVMFGDSWGVEHNFQGNKTHMGTAIIDRENIRGRISVVSMTGGTVREASWDNNLGYFVGIITENNTYYLYAHLDSIAQGITAGKRISAGEHLGQMGNSGGGRSRQSFPVHLHIAIAPDVSFTRGNFWINPYPLLRYIENPTEF
jgi:murein DD-endopeptidase MepM/ murein hydrolase activator NlpD